MILRAQSQWIADALNAAAREFPDRWKIRRSGGGDGFSANPEGGPGFVCPEQTGKTDTCGTCGVACAFSPRPVQFLGHGRPWGGAAQGRTMHPGTLYRAGGRYKVLKDGNDKTGKKVTRGPWKGARIKCVSLEERDTCPPTCPHWADCYGNGMYRAHRFLSRTEEDRAALLAALEAEIGALNPNKLWVIRLHILGDFFSVEYVEFWRRMLRERSNIVVFGYTAHPVEV